MIHFKMENTSEEKVKLSLFADVFNTQKNIQITRKSLDLVNPFNKVAGYKINTKISSFLVYANNKLTMEELRKNNHSQ